MEKLILPISKRDHVQGKEHAPVTFVEYGDYECPYCGQAYGIIQQLKRQEGERMRFVFRNFPLSQIHPHALHAAYSAEAASLQGKFWEMHDLLFKNQHALEDQDLLAYAQAIDLVIEQFINDFRSEAVREKVQEDFMSGLRSGVNGTPTFFINGVRYDGSYELDMLTAAIEEASTPKRYKKGGLIL
jgi:protein-disulfide isomerase